MNRSILFLLFVVTACLTLAPFSFAQTLRADYQFQGNLNSSVGTAPALTNLVAAGNGQNTFATVNVDGYSRQVLNFPLNNGVSINDFTAIVPNTQSFTVVVLFKFSAMSGMRRLVDASAGTAPDSGIFMFDGKIIDEVSSHAPTDIDSYFQVVVVRGASGVFAIYRDNIIALNDSDDGTPLSAGLRFFQDWSGAAPVQASSGSIARLRVYDGPMTVQQVHQLDRVPETPSGLLPILYYSGRNGVTEMFRMNSDGTSQKRITNNEVVDFLGKFSPDGQKIVYQRRETGTDPFQIWVSNSDGSNPVRLTNTTTVDKAPSWRPDGQKILFSRCINGGTGVCDLFTMDPNGSNQAAVSTTATDEDLATFTPDGTKLVFACSDQNLTNYQICVSNANGTGRVAITNTTAPVFSQHINISPDGTKLACLQGSGGGGFTIKTMNLDGSNVVTWPAVINPQFPLWSPDGNKIMYSAAAGNQLEIFTANPNGTSPTRITFNSALDIATDWYRPPVVSRRAFDYDGDGLSDVSVWRQSNGTWYVARSGLNDMYVQPWGLNGDTIVPADYDGDGKTDLAVRRPSDNNFYIFNSSNATVEVRNFGIAGDVAVPSDYNGDGKADVSVWRPSTGTWYLSLSGSGIFYVMPWGLASDKPAPGDFDGDGKTELVVFRPSDGKWYTFSTVTGTISVTEWGVNGDRPVQGDYNGDGRTDFAVYRPSNNTWYRQNSNDGAVTSTQWGLAGDFPVPGDYDGDGKIDVAVWRPSDATWYVNRSSSGIFTQAFGINGDTPTPSAFVF